MTSMTVIQECNLPLLPGLALGFGFGFGLGLGLGLMALAAAILVSIVEVSVAGNLNCGVSRDGSSFSGCELALGFLGFFHRTVFG